MFDLEDMDPELEPLLEARDKAERREPSRSDMEIEDGSYYFFANKPEIPGAEVRVGKVDLEEAYRSDNLEKPVKGFYRAVVDEDSGEMTVMTTDDRWEPHFNWENPSDYFVPVKVDQQTVRDLNDYLIEQGMFESI